MLNKNRFWYFDRVLTNKFCDEIIKTGLAKEKQIALTGQSKKSNKKQSKKIRELEDQLKEHGAYKQLIIAATKTHNDPQTIVEGLKLTAENIKAKNWPMVDRVGGSSGDIEARGACPVCRINLVGKDLRPREITFPCGVAGWPYEKRGKNNY